MDPLAQLKDIHLPEQVHQYPIAPGWWVLLLLTLVIVVIGVRAFVKFRNERKVKKQVLAVVKDAKTPQETLTLLKVALMHYFPRSVTAQLHGDALKAFLENCLPESKQSQFGQQIQNYLSECYQATSGLDQPAFNQAMFNQATLYWLQHALPPKKAVQNATLQKLNLSGNRNIANKEAYSD